MRILIHVIVLFLVLCFASCHSPRREARRMIAHAETLADTMPDSTVLLIDSVLRMEVLFSEKSRMEMVLLQADLLLRDVSLDDDDINEVLNRRLPSPYLERSTDYFSGKKEYAKAARAALYSGYVHYYFKETVNAIQSFKMAEQYGNLANDSLIVAKAQYKMGEMFYDDYMEREALTMFSQAEQGFVDDENHAMALNMMAVTYIMLHQFDSAEMCLERSGLIAEQCQSAKMRGKTLNNYAVLYRLQGKYDQAIECIKKIDIENDSVAMMMSFLNLGKVFAVSGNIDSAFCYYQRLASLLPLVDTYHATKASSYRALSNFSEETGDLVRALQYRKQYDQILGLILEEIQEKNAYSVQRKYDYDNLQNMMNRKMIRKHRIIVVVSLLALIGFVALSIVQMHLVKTRKAEAEAKNNLFHFMERNKELCEVNEMKEKEVVDYAMRYSDALEKQMQTMLKLDIYYGNRGDIAYLKALEEAVFEHEDHWEAMIKVFDTLYPGVRENIALQHPELTEMEQRVFMLSYFNTSRDDEALLFGKSVHLVDKLRSGVKKKLQNNS